MGFDRNRWKSNIPTRELLSRINRAKCQWNLELCSDSIADLRQSDPGAFRVMKALIETSIESGLPTSSNGDGYRAPVGKDVRREDFAGRDMPWLGELRVDERDPKKPSKMGNALEHRLYFGEPDEPNSLVLGASMGSKRGQEKNVSPKQTKQMRGAMWAVIKWCEETAEPPTGWRTWNWDC